MLADPRRPRTFAGSAALFLLLSATFLLEWRTAAIGNDGRMLALGALPDSGGIHGEYWRLVTFGFLHSDLTHLLLNSALLLLAAPAVERRAGTVRLLLLFLSASVASGIGILVKHQLWPSHGVSVGASGGLFGLLAAALVLAVRSGAPAALRAALAIAIAAGLAYSLLPGISMVGHLVGLGVGAGLALVIPIRVAPRMPVATPAR
jgi:rhomboid protease GluP